MTREELESKIKYYAEKYYIGEPEISDGEFDALVDELQSIAPDSEVLNSVGWGSGVEKIDGKKANHRYGKVCGLPKVKTVDNLALYGDSVVVSAKLDGLSCVLYYKDGKLKEAMTRGNGESGVVITDKVLRILDNKGSDLGAFTGAIRGELVISNENWSRLIEIHPEYSSPDKNPRNIGAGFINRDGMCDELDYMSLVVYNMVANERYGVSSQDDVYRFLNNYFEDVCDFRIYHSDEWADEEFLAGLYEEFRSKYPCDGLVIGSDHLDSNGFEVVYSQVAFKFEAESKETVINGIEWNLTRTGKLVPIVLIDTIQISGTNVSRATAYNARYIKDNNIRVGTRVLVQKSNEIIPKIIKVLD